MLKPAGVFRGNGGSITTIADTDGPLSGFGGITSINVNGTVAFRATVDGGGDGIFSGNGEQRTTIANSTGPFASFITDGPWINDNGRVVFFATLDTGDEGIFTGSGRRCPIATIADASEDFASFGIYPSINSTAIVAFSLLRPMREARVFLSVAAGRSRQSQIPLALLLPLGIVSPSRMRA